MELSAGTLFVKLWAVIFAVGTHYLTYSHTSDNGAIFFTEYYQPTSDRNRCVLKIVLTLKALCDIGDEIE